MKLKIKILLELAVVASIMLTSCLSHESIIEPEVNEKYKLNLSGEIDQIYQTRVNDAGFCNGDEVGI